MQNHRSTITAFLLLNTSLVACGDDPKDDGGMVTAGDAGGGSAGDGDGDGDDSSGGGTDGDGSGSGDGDAGGSDGGDDSSGGSDGGGSGGDSDGGSVFIVEPDGGGTGVECDLWNQDCPTGQKCMPWANDGGNSWNATKCSPVDASPNQPGDACTVEGSGVAGVDDCDVSSMCWGVSGDTGMGTCVGFCEGSPDSPQCADPDTRCSITNDGVLILCLPVCDPLLQDCPETEACYLENGDFLCSPDASGTDLGGYGDPCEYINACDAGLLCAAAASVPGCSTGSCCTEFCDLEESNNCSGAGEGQTCTPVFDDGAVPPGYENVGFCSLPS